MRSSHDFRTGRHVVFDLHAHIVLTPKYRKKVMTDRVTELLSQSFDHTATRLGFTITEFSTDRDHAHVLVSYPPKLSLSTIVAALKTNSSKLLRTQQLPEIERALWGSHLWSPSYFVASTGGATLEKVQRYVHNQGQPNKKEGNPTWVKKEKTA